MLFFCLLYFIQESEIGYPLIKKQLQNMVNQSKHFPSFRDVLEIVEKTNNQYKLNLKLVKLYCKINE